MALFKKYSKKPVQKTQSEIQDEVAHEQALSDIEPQQTPNEVENAQTGVPEVEFQDAELGDPSESIDDVSQSQHQEVVEDSPIESQFPEENEIRTELQSVGSDIHDSLLGEPSTLSHEPEGDEEHSDQTDDATHAADAKTTHQEEEEPEPEEIPLDPEVLAELKEIEEDLSILDGRILPDLKVPNWREELDFVKERYEPCDLTDHIVKVSKRRLVARRIDHEVAQSRLTAYERYLERATRRFKDKIDEDAVLSKAQADISQWRSDQAKSVAWLLADRINEEVLKAKQAEEEATAFVEQNTEFTNPSAVATYRKFARSMFLIPVATAYIMSVVMLTYTNLEWIMKFLPFFNLGLAKTQFMIAGISSYFLLRAMWRYAREVAKIQKKLVAFNTKYQEQEKRIRHAVKEHTRLAQQQPMVEPILEVLSKAYRVQLQSDVSVKAQATTEFDPASLPACVTLARAVDTEEDKMARLKRRALSVLMSPGWRTRGLNEIATIHADTRMLDSHSLSLASLDTDSMISATSAQKILLEAFSNTSIHSRVSKRRLVKAIKEIHSEVLANWNSDDRPNVSSLRNDGFNKIAFRTSWLADEDTTESWIPFLTEILSEETAPFGQFNILDKRSELNKPELISSVAVVPHYFNLPESRVKVEHSKSTEVMPLDVVVRVDVSAWSEPNAFAVFADDVKKASKETLHEILDSTQTQGGVTGA